MVSRLIVLCSDFFLFCIGSIRPRAVWLCPTVLPVVLLGLSHIVIVEMANEYIQSRLDRWADRNKCNKPYQQQDLFGGDVHHLSYTCGGVQGVVQHYKTDSQSMLPYLFTIAKK